MKRLPTLLLPLLCILTACYKSTPDTQEIAVSNSEVVRLSQTGFGTTGEGKAVDLFTLRNVYGLEVEIITYGGIIRALRVPDREGNLGDIVHGYDNLEDYVANNPYFGAIIGRYGNRIANGRFPLDGEEYNLAINNDPNHLHGGVKGFDKVVWEAEPFENDSSAGLQLTYRSPHMEEGYPGNLDVTVTYTLDDQNRLIFDYHATTDRPTVVNLTNHAYYNLSGNENDILDHILEINGDKFLPVDSTLIPEDPEPVQGTPFDFTEPARIGDRINEPNQQLANGGGYDHCWILNTENEPLGFAASLYDPASGRMMEIFTTEPGIQFYSGNFLDGSISGKQGEEYGFRSALCLETQHFPDSPNRPDFPAVQLRPGEEYTSRTITVFSTREKDS